MSSASVGDYRQFLESKFKFSKSWGFEVAEDEVHPLMKPHQRDVIRWAVKKGRAAIFKAFGLGKGMTQQETLRLVLKHDGKSGSSLIVAPLGVRIEFMRDAAKLGINLRFVRSSAEVTEPGAYITNYESVRDGKLDVNLFRAVSLDEASVLRSYGSKTYQEFLTLFADVPFRFVATATPSPNRYKELIHYAGFLGIMDTGQALTRFFQRDSTQANNLTLYPHKESEFFLWLHSWAIFLQRPSDLGYSDEGYDLPPLTVTYHEVRSRDREAKADRDGQLSMINDAALGLKEAAAEKRDSIAERVETMGEIIDGYLRGTQGVHEGLLGAEPRSAAGEAAHPRQGQLLGEQRGVQTEVQALARGKPGTVSTADQELRRREPGKDQGNEPSLVCCEQGSSERHEPGEQTEGLRPDGGSVRRDAGIAGGRMPHLRDEDEGASGGPRPRNGRRPRAAVQGVQLRVGAIQGQPCRTDASGPVPDQIVIWCDLNSEQDAIEQALAQRGLTFSSVHGSLDTDEVERRLEEWRDRKTYALIGKPVMLGQGMNLQQCNKAVFVGITYKFNDLIQAVHRVHRFLQDRGCEIHLIYSDTEREVLKVLQQKWQEHDALTARMSELIKEHGLSTTGLETKLARTIGVQRQEESGAGWVFANNDCVDECDLIESNSVDLIHTSIPFGNHYEYSASYNDFGHNDDNARFFEQMDHLTPKLLRILKPGRVYACHVKDRIRFGNVTGYGMPSVDPFHSDCIAHYRRHGFIYFGMITVVTDVVRENNQTYRLGWSEQCKDGTKMGVGSPEYILLFRKLPTDTSKGYADERVSKSKADYTRGRWQIDAAAFWRSSGNRFLSAEEMAGYGADKIGKVFCDQSLRQVYDYAEHVKLAEALDAKGALPSTFATMAPGSHHPDVWHDVNRMLTLNGDQSRRGLEQHICPLQFDIVDRIITRFTNAGELVFDPFGGLCTVPYRAIKLGRKGRAVELNPSYWRDGLRNMRAAEQELSVVDMFGFEEVAEAA